jgi:hypothetical protein
MLSLRSRCSIEIVNVHGEVVPILDEGATITPGSPTTKYREYWTEEEDLQYVYPYPNDGSSAKDCAVEHRGGVHGNFGFELLLDEQSGHAAITVDYFAVVPFAPDGRFALIYEPKQATLTGVLGRNEMAIEIELQPGFSAGRDDPPFKSLRVRCR